MAFEIVDTPEANRSGLPPDRANLLSDKNSRARDNAEGPPEGDLPYSQGDIDVKSLDPSSTRNAQLSQMGENANARERETETREAWAEARTWNEGSGFSRERLLGQSPSQPAVRYKQEASSARDVGGLSFNTYAWDFAPYMLKLKHKIERNIYPPAAFTRLGFGGNNVLRFRIHPDGRLEGPGVLGYDGDKSLIQTSQTAIMASAPFDPLPKEFPEPFLEVTARFEYYTR